MAVNHGRLEGEFTIGTGGLDLRALDDGGIFTATVAAGDYYLATFLPALKAALDAAGDPAVTWTVSIADGEDGSGKVTISATSAAVEIYFASASTDDEMWQLMGFLEQTYENDTSHTGPDSARMIWLPNGPKQTPYGDGDSGIEVDDTRSTHSASGHKKTVYGQTKTILPVRWLGLSFARVRIIAETVVNQSWQRFRADVCKGQGPGALPGAEVRLYWDADAGTYITVTIDGAQEGRFTSEAMQAENVGGPHIVAIDFTLVPS